MEIYIDDSFDLDRSRKRRYSSSSEEVQQKDYKKYGKEKDNLVYASLDPNGDQFYAFKDIEVFKLTHEIEKPLIRIFEADESFISEFNAVKDNPVRRSRNSLTGIKPETK